MTRARLIAALAALAGCGQAQAATHTWQATGFSRLRVEAPFDVRVRTGVPASVRATGNQALIDRVTVEQRGDTLVIGTVRQSGRYDGGAKLVIDVGAPSLAGATLAGSGDVAVDRVRGAEFDATLSGSGDLAIGDAALLRLKAMLGGSGNLTIAGHADAASAVITGSGDLKGDRFVADRADLNLAGSGNLAIGAKRVERVKLSGSGDIRVLGDGACTGTGGGSDRDITGSGTLTCGRGGD